MIRRQTPQTILAVTLLFIGCERANAPAKSETEKAAQPAKSAPVKVAAATATVAKPVAPSEDSFPFVDPVAVSPDHYEVMVENEWARLLRVKLKPGAKDKIHSHPRSVIYALTPFEGRAIRGDGSSEKIALAEGASAVRAPMRAVAFENTGKKNAEFLLFEVESKPPKVEPEKNAAPDTVDAAPEAYSVLQDLPQARLLLFVTKPGQKVKAHSRKPHIIYTLTDADEKIFVGRVQRTSVKGNMAYDIPAIPTLMVENVGKTESRTVLLELK